MLHCTPDEALHRIPQRYQWTEIEAYYELKRQDRDREDAHRQHGDAHQRNLQTKAPGGIGRKRR